MSPRLIDLLIRAGTIYPMTREGDTAGCIAIRDDRIVAVDAHRNALDHLITAGTKVIDDPDLTLMPAFNDTHCHLIQAGRNMLWVELDKAQTISEVIHLVKARAEITPPGEWIFSANNWHEDQLAEKRLPYATELDEATTQHPVVLKRGGHLAIVNSFALKLGGVTSDTPDPRGGTIGRLPDGSLSGLLIEAPARLLVERLAPPLSFDQQVQGLARATAIFAARGIGSVRDPLVTPDEMLVYQDAWQKGMLSLRCQTALALYSQSKSERIAMMKGWGVSSGFGDDLLKIWGLKFVLDGGAEAAALEQPYSDNPGFSGHLQWQVDEMVEMFNASVRRGWKIATHAVGDRAVRTLLDAYEQVLHDNPGLPSGSLVLEHAFLADKVQRARAIRAGIPVTVQHPLLYALGAELLRKWGPQRTREIMPVKAWMDEGAILAAGSDYPVGPWDPLQSIWGLVTRGTRGAGIQGPEYAIDRYNAIRLYTSAAAELTGDGGRLGKLTEGQFADLTAFRKNPFKCSDDELLDMSPTFTMVGGRIVYGQEAI